MRGHTSRQQRGASPFGRSWVLCWKTGGAFHKDYHCSPGLPLVRMSLFNILNNIGRKVFCHKNAPNDGDYPWLSEYKHHVGQMLTMMMKIMMMMTKMVMRLMFFIHSGLNIKANCDDISFKCLVPGKVFHHKHVLYDPWCA